MPPASSIESPSGDQRARTSPRHDTSQRRIHHHTLLLGSAGTSIRRDRGAVRARPQTPRATERGTSSPSAAGHPRALKVPKRLPKLTTSRSAEEHQRELRSPKHGASNSEDTCTALQSRLRRFDSRRRLFCLQISGYCGSNCLCRCRQRRRPSAPKPEVVHPAMIPSGPGFRARGRSLVDWDETRVEVRAVPRVLELERSQRESANRVGLLEYRCGYAQPARLCSRGPTRRRGSGDPNVALACLSSRSH